MAVNAALLACTLAGPALADRRTLIRAYEFETQPKGNLELEIWNDVIVPKSAFADAVITQKIELEYGLTDRWDLALYHVFSQGGPADSEDRGFHFDSWRLETRYRLAEKGEWPIDVMVYLEVERPAKFDEPFELEEKIILQKDFGPLAIVANLVAEQKLSGSQTGHVWEVDLGARYEVAPAFRLGAEVWGVQEIAPGGSRDLAFYAGPSVSFATKKLWIQLGAGVGLNDAAGSAQIRSVIGFNL